MLTVVKGLGTVRRELDAATMISRLKVSNESMTIDTTLRHAISRIAEAAEYLGIGKGRESSAIRDVASLAAFIESRASHVSQTALYGYLKTRAGTRFPELFEHPEYIKSINIAKWQVWLAAVSDLTMFSGVLLSRGGLANPEVRECLRQVVDMILDNVGLPSDSGPDFQSATRGILARLEDADWSRLGDDDSCFTESPDALVAWAPVVEHLKELDAEIVRNSVRFRWIEVRRELRRLLDPGVFMPLR
jgi:hypothetical protein